LQKKKEKNQRRGKTEKVNILQKFHLAGERLPRGLLKGDVSGKAERSLQGETDWEASLSRIKRGKKHQEWIGFVRCSKVADEGKGGNNYLKPASEETNKIVETTLIPSSSSNGNRWPRGRN